MTAMDDTREFFASQVEENMKSLYSLAMRLTKNTADAEDLLADTVTKAWSVIHTLEDRSRFRAWIFRILHNHFISNYRKQSVRPSEHSLDEMTDNSSQQIASLLIEQPDEFVGWWANPEKRYTTQLLGEDILSAIDSLPENYRLVVILINVEGLSYDETADMLNVSPGTVRSRMNRGRTLLQKALWQHAKDNGLIDRSCNTR